MRLLKLIKERFELNSQNRTKEYPYGLRPLPYVERSFILTLPVIRFFVMIIRVLFLILIDGFRKFKNRKNTHLYGIWCFVGLPGYGKTMSLVNYLDNQRRKYGDGIIIITNFFYAGEDHHLQNWEMLLKEYDRPVIFAWDELQNEFNTREYKRFPTQLVRELTQNRKGNGKQVVYTTQTFTAVDKNFRNLTTKVVDCRTFFGRLTVCHHYKTELFEIRKESKSLNNKVRIRPNKRERFVQTDFLRSRYNSFQRLDYLKGLSYNGLSEDKQD